MAALNFHHLRLFQAVAEEGGVTTAARRLNLSPSALSTQLQKLEAALGHPLFERQGRRLVLTEAGRIASDYAGTVFSTGEELVSTLAGLPKADRQGLRVGAITTLSRNFQIEFLRPLLGRDDVKLTVRSGTMRELIDLLDAHRLDVVLSNAPPPRDDGRLHQARLLDRQPVSMVGPRALAGEDLRFPEALHGREVVLPSRDADLRFRFDQMVQARGLKPVVLAEVDDMAMMRLLARESGALALVPPIVVRDELESGILVEHWRVPQLSEDFYAIKLRRRFPNRLLEALLPPQ